MRITRRLWVIVLVLGLLLGGVSWTYGTTQASALGETPTFEKIYDSAHKISYAELVFHHLRYEGQPVHFTGKLFRVYYYDDKDYEFVVQVYGTPDADTSSKRFNIIHLVYSDGYEVAWESLPEGTEIEFVATMVQMGEIELADGTTITRPLMLVEHIRLV